MRQLQGVGTRGLPGAQAGAVGTQKAAAREGGPGEPGTSGRSWAEAAGTAHRHRLASCLAT